MQKRKLFHIYAKKVHPVVTEGRTFIPMYKVQKVDKMKGFVEKGTSLVTSLLRLITMEKQFMFENQRLFSYYRNINESQLTDS